VSEPAEAGSGRPAEAGWSRRAVMQARDFKRFAEFISSECGIKLPPTKKTMLEARLQRRLRDLGLPGFAAYWDYLTGPEREEELARLLDVVTTNTTDFFREPRHFEFLARSVLPAWAAANGTRTLRVWSAGCSTGMEPYTLAMVLADWAERRGGLFWKILGTDISTRALDAARRAVYPEDQVKAVPGEMKRRYLLRSKDRAQGLVRVVPDLRSQVAFMRLNFMNGFDLGELMDVIFCRNVLIYFERSTQEALLGRLCGHLLPGGHLFIGHSESITGMSLPLVQIAPTVYRRAS
jgi:chemotaxis protein methyltransferase CheR